jgi:hypothetical protein
VAVVGDLAPRGVSRTRGHDCRQAGDPVPASPLDVEFGELERNQRKEECL